MNKNEKKKETHRVKDYKNLRQYPVKKECELLSFLLETFSNQSRNSVKSLLGSHRVSVDGAPVTQFNFKLYPGDTVIISTSPIKKKTRSKGQKVNIFPLFILKFAKTPETCLKSFLSDFKQNRYNPSAYPNKIVHRGFCDAKFLAKI